MLIRQILDGAGEANLPLATNRCEALEKICSFVEPKQARGITLSNLAERKQVRKRAGGFQYRPEYMLQCVRLADCLILCRIGN